MNSHLRNLAQQASRKIDLTYPGDAFPASLANSIVKDLDSEFAKIKWVDDDEGWNRAIEAVRKEIKTRYGT